MTKFICPKCREPLERSEGAYRCRCGHSYDIAREGYVNLLLANMMNSKDPGDSKEMAKARNLFLSKGYYKPLSDAINETVGKYAHGAGTLLDCGCGEGYYTANIKKAFPELSVSGIDISKPSVKIAAKRDGRIELAVASVFDIPVPDESFDILLNCFSPLCEKEYRRVLRPNGIYIYVVPGPRHLWQMKEAIYDEPYENAEEAICYEGFSHLGCEKVRYDVRIEEKEDIESLFRMTPYYWKTSAKGSEKLSSIETLETEISFDIHIYEKVR